MNFVDLVHFVVSREERKQGQNFKKYTPHSPVIHFVIVVAVSKKTLGGTVPSCRNVLCEWWLGVNPSTGTEVSQLNLVIFNQNVFAMKVHISKAYGLISR